MPASRTRRTNATTPPPITVEGRQRVVIESVTPCVDGGRFAVKRVLGESVQVEADIFCDGHDVLRCLLRHRHGAAGPWQETPLRALGNDR